MASWGAATAFFIGALASAWLGCNAFTGIDDYSVGRAPSPSDAADSQVSDVFVDSTASETTIDVADVSESDTSDAMPEAETFGVTFGCEGGRLCTKPEVCCKDSGGKWGCFAASACVGDKYACDSASDCPTGSSCCATGGGTGSICFSPLGCGGVAKEFCTSDTDCVSGSCATMPTDGPPDKYRICN